MTIKWTIDYPEATYSSQTGVDERENIYHMTANQEIVTVETPCGKRGMGWTAQEALVNATLEA